jgi:hypothetical protein
MVLGAVSGALAGCACGRVIRSTSDEGKSPQHWLRSAPFTKGCIVDRMNHGKAAER